MRRPHCLLDRQCASLTALKKEDGSHRPVAVGDTLRRLTAKALLATVSEEVTRYLGPTQLGFGTIRWLQKNDNNEKRCLLTMDMENACNLIDWSCFLREIRRKQDLARYCDLCYSNDGFVLFGPEKIPSKSKVQQGDVPGPLPFALGFDKAISEGPAQAEASNSPLDMTVLFLDDGTVGGSHKPTQAILADFRKGVGG